MRDWRDPPCRRLEETRPDADVPRVGERDREEKSGGVIQINNWSSYQSYKDRKPPWIRLHKSILDNYEFHAMSANARALLPMLWLLASEDEDPVSGMIRYGYEKVAFRLRLPLKDITAGINELEKSLFLQQIPSRNETVTEPLRIRTQTVTSETETYKEETEDTLSGKPDDVPVGEIIEYLNSKAGKKYNPKSTACQKHIRARWGEGARIEQFRAAIDNQVRAWKGTDKEFYLRPSTLFNSEKFDGYVNNVEIKAGFVDPTSHCSFPGCTGPGSQVTRSGQRFCRAHVPL